jgi:BirA family biotin operon repressor/biotin-[acetyl-CoA-carboxylase] ligase
MNQARLGHPRWHLRHTDSTNLRARELAIAGAPHGTLVTAAAQSAGRGRQGRGWRAPAGGSLLMSLVLRDPPPRLALIAGVAVAAAAETLDTERRAALVKWPNDVLLDGRKVAGILVEGRPQQRWAVLGIGLNVAFAPSDLGPSLANRAASLGLVAGDDVERARVEVLRELTRVLVQPDREVLDRLRSRDALHGRPVSWAAGSGIGAGIDAAGRLRVDTERGMVALDAGEVHLDPPAVQ